MIRVYTINEKNIETPNDQGINERSTENPNDQGINERSTGTKMISV